MFVEYVCPISEKYLQNLSAMALGFLIMLLSILKISDIPLLSLDFPIRDFNVFQVFFRSF